MSVFSTISKAGDILKFTPISDQETRCDLSSGEWCSVATSLDKIRELAQDCFITIRGGFCYFDFKNAPDDGFLLMGNLQRVVNWTAPVAGREGLE